jgi:hypothetical protein
MIERAEKYFPKKQVVSRTASGIRNQPFTNLSL